MTGVIDFDVAAPGPRLRDLAYTAYRMCPLLAPVGPPTLDRLNEFLAAYGTALGAGEVLTDTSERLEELADFSIGHAAVTGNADLIAHARGYRADAAHLRGLAVP